MTSNLDFKVTIFFIVKYLENVSYKIKQYLQWQTGRKSSVIYWMLLFSITPNHPNPDLRERHYSTEYLRNGSRQTRGRLQLIESDMWPIEHRQWPWRNLKVISSIFVRNKLAYFSGLLLSSGDLTKDDIASNPGWPFKVISGTINGFVVYISKCSIMMYKVNSRTSYVSNYFCCRILFEWLLYDAERDLFAKAKFLVRFY